MATHKTINLSDEDIQNLPSVPVAVVPAVEGYEVIVHDFDQLTLEVEYELRPSWPDVIGDQ